MKRQTEKACKRIRFAIKPRIFLDIVDNLFVCAYMNRYFLARVAELEDALDFGSSPRKRIGVQVPSLAPDDLSASNINR